MVGMVWRRSQSDRDNHQNNHHGCDGKESGKCEKYEIV